MGRFYLVDVACQCGEHLFRYAKGGKGRLIKCFLDQIDQDAVGVVDAPLGARPVCPRCGKAVGRVRMVRGRAALKLNQGAVRKVTV